MLTPIYTNIHYSQFKSNMLKKNGLFQRKIIICISFLSVVLIVLKINSNPKIQSRNRQAIPDNGCNNEVINFEKSYIRIIKQIICSI